MTTGERITRLRESRDVLQKELAKAIDVDPVVLNRIEKGKRSARGEEIKAIADYFNVSTDYLLGRETPKAPALSDEQTTVLKGFDSLNSAGRNLLVGVLNSLRVSHAAIA
ncbi:MAG: helix-turn-helix transcriptional regulator [Selenomonadaceae bacterium]|nr:helix-turn-helix transcriptional regulator [Selenomonadaceae bacterium]